MTIEGRGALAAGECGRLRAGSGPHRDRRRLLRPAPRLAGLTASDERLEGNIGDHLGVSSPVSAVVAYSPAVTCSYPAGATRWRLRWRLRRLRRCLGSTGPTMSRSVETEARPAVANQYSLPGSRPTSR